MNDCLMAEDGNTPALMSEMNHNGLRNSQVQHQQGAARA